MPLSIQSSISSGSGPASPVFDGLHRVGSGFESDGSQPPPLFYDTSDESDYDPTGLLTPVSINLEYEREWQKEQQRYRQERQIRRAQYERAKQAEAALEASKAAAGVYMRTRAGIFRNEKELTGWDGFFCYLDGQGKIEITESVWAYVMRHVDSDTACGQDFQGGDCQPNLISEGSSQPSSHIPKVPKVSGSRIQKSWRARKTVRKHKISAL